MLKHSIHNGLIFSGQVNLTTEIEMTPLFRFKDIAPPRQFAGGANLHMQFENSIPHSHQWNANEYKQFLSQFFLLNHLVGTNWHTFASSNQKVWKSMFEFAYFNAILNVKCAWFNRILSNNKVFSLVFSSICLRAKLDKRGGNILKL